ncbi:BMC domain-containing protein [Paenibacillus pasadenensis]|uniref:BMC domain-containing protein n=1 Tax=Paenibacillus pasadenensis TaxID=217090 RepID=UPI00203C1776|nr:BMC domain-containing protein [Paenibacillus pasadenensis]MCM3749987.1 BMC domain-containing protein [Paenibacillus pasadenensis]
MTEGNGQALGMIETMGLVALIAAADAAAKTADVKVHTYEKADAGIMTVYIYGDISSVQEAVRAGMETAKALGKLLHYSVIPRPAFDFTEWIQKKTAVKGAAASGAPAATAKAASAAAAPKSVKPAQES